VNVEHLDDGELVEHGLGVRPGANSLSLAQG
jgi:hypothetical protein